MIRRIIFDKIVNNLASFPAIGLLGSRQVGKTTLSLEIGKKFKMQYLDLENPIDLIKLDDPISYLQGHNDKLVILDEIQRKSEIFPILRGIIDKNRQAGKRNGQFLILGSASVELLRQSSESLAGRIMYQELSPLNSREYTEDLSRIWIRGGYPDSLLASTNQISMDWRIAFISTYLERDIPMFGSRVPAESMRRFWTMLAHNQGSLFNASRLSASMSMSSPSIVRYVDLLTDLFLVRRLQPWYENVGKRLTKSPKLYIRDTGILHALLNIQDLESLYSHPVVGFSWEGFVIENLISISPPGSEFNFYRTARGAEIDLLIKHSDGRTIAIEIKKSLVPRLDRGFHEACKDVKPTEKYVVYQGEESFKVKPDILAISLHDMMEKLE